MRPPQTRTTPAAKTITCEEPLSAPFDHETASIPKMIARLRFLEADCRYHTAICDPVAKSVALNIRHSEEHGRDYATARQNRAGSFDAMELLDFATKRDAKNP